MCGILGTTRNIHSEIFKQALSLLRHRGPDNTGISHQKGIILGHTRLAIIDLFERSDQPMHIDGISITFNGEIYNYKELIEQHALICTGKSDTEVIIHLYKKYGISCLEYLNGMFSFALVDHAKNKIYLARDRFGKKPLYFLYKNHHLTFSSEIKAILKTLDYIPEMNFSAFNQFLSFMTPIHNETFYKDINKLKAGHYLEFSLTDKKLNITRYYQLSRHSREMIDDEYHAIEGIESHLKKSVNYRLIADTDIATFLSGGIDSSLISAIFTREKNRKIDTFTIGYDEYKKYDELEQASIVSKHINSRHHEITINSKQFVETIDNCLDILDEPLGDSAIIPTYHLSKAVHESGFKVCLSGEGSDEIFLGYDNYFDLLKYESLRENCNHDNKLLLNAFFENQSDLSKKTEHFRRALSEHAIFRTTGETFTDSLKNRLFNIQFEKNLSVKTNSSIPVDKQYTCMDFKVWIAEVLMTKLDRMSMAHSLEIRAPFLDLNLVEFAMKISSGTRTGSTTKHLLKKVALEYLPESIVYRRKKGFSSPYIEWLYKEYNDHIIHLMLKVNSELDIFKNDFLVNLYHEGKKGNFKQQVWSLFIFCHWYKKNHM